MYVDDGGKEAITKALKVHCPPFNDHEGKFLLTFQEEGLQIYVFPSSSAEKRGESLEELITCLVTYYAWFYAWF